MSSTPRAKALPQSSGSSDLSEPSDDRAAIPKRPRPSTPKSSHSTKRPKLDTDANQEKGTYCHQCHTKCAPDEWLRCTKLKSFTKHTPLRPCNLAWCGKDLSRKYNINVAQVKSSAAGESYEFTCPVCLDQCECAHCRKKKGLEPLGNTPKEKSAPKQKSPKEKKPSTQNATPKAADRPPKEPKKKVKPKQDSSTFLAGSDSDLSDPPEDGVNRTIIAKPPVKKKKKVVLANGLANGVNGKTVKPPATKPIVKAKPKPRPKPKPIVQPPIFEKVDTRSSRSEVEDRIALREFLFRFRGVLSIPERNLSILDDFDRALTEGSVRLYAGSLLEMIKEDLDDEELEEDLFNYREELRYYADLARFAAIYKLIQDPLELQRQSPRTPPRNDNILRSVFDLGEDDPIPWDLPARRGASRVPLPNEVVDMLLALAERSLSTKAIRAELDGNSGETEARKIHTAVTKSENAEWDDKKKKLAEERVLCKNAAQTKANQNKTSEAQKTHELEIALANVNLRASIQPLRHEPLGKDLDGRTYYLLTPRPITESSRAPIGWASGLLVFGSAALKDESDELPLSAARWSHFGKSTLVTQLAKWLDDRLDILAATKRRKSQVEVVIYQRASDSDSDLSSAPEDLLELLEPSGYEPSVDRRVEDGRELVKRVREVAEWLQVLEWKGMGEV